MVAVIVILGGHPWHWGPLFRRFALQLFVLRVLTGGEWLVRHCNNIIDSFFKTMVKVQNNQGSTLTVLWAYILSCLFLKGNTKDKQSFATPKSLEGIHILYSGGLTLFERKVNRSQKTLCALVKQKLTSFHGNKTTSIRRTLTELN